jgi:hypothetical protein
MQADGERSGRVVLLRFPVDRRSVDEEADLGRIVAIARGLQPDELLAIASRTEPNLADLRHRLEPGDLEVTACSFAPDDHEIFVWQPPPHLPSDCGEPVAGELVFDVRPLPPLLALVCSVAAAARLAPGEVLAQIGSRPPLLLVDLLASRAVVGALTGTGDRVVSRFVRCAGATPPAGGLEAPDEPPLSIRSRPAD